jgi:dTDP-4-dehydrorhamnose 3,5-epimerase
MSIEQLSIEGAWVITPRQLADDRGTFLEAFQGAALAEATGRELRVAQVNTSVSRAGVVRGIHFSDVPPSQAKYVTCPRGAIWDVVVDIRVGSPTFGRWEGVLLDDVDRRAVFLSEGLGHGFVALEDDSTAVYLCSTPYAPGREHGVHPLDPALDIAWPTTGRDGSAIRPLLSDKDAAAPTLASARDEGLLPTMDAVREFLGTL